MQSACFLDAPGVNWQLGRLGCPVHQGCTRGAAADVLSWCTGKMIFTGLMMTKLGAPFEDSRDMMGASPSYQFTADPSYGDSDYPNGYTAMYVSHPQEHCSRALLGVQGQEKRLGDLVSGRWQEGGGGGPWNRKVLGKDHSRDTAEHSHCLDARLSGCAGSGMPFVIAWGKHGRRCCGVLVLQTSSRWVGCRFGRSSCAGVP